jgi:hypothetical protein
MSRIKRAQCSIGTLLKGSPFGNSGAAPLLDEHRTKPELIEKSLSARADAPHHQQVGQRFGLGDRHGEAHPWGLGFVDTRLGPRSVPPLVFRFAILIPVPALVWKSASGRARCRMPGALCTLLG